jgi:regulator of sigma E protease
MVTLLAFIVLFGLVVFVHELGHFAAGKLGGARVDEFGFGYPPRLFSLGKWHGTEYTINALPIGGFVKMGEEDLSRPDNLASKSKKVRTAVYLAGPFMNLLLAALCYIIVFMFGQKLWTGRVVIQDIAANSPAALAGLQKGDQIAEINDMLVQSTLDIHDAVTASLGRSVTLTILRGEERLSISLVPRANPPAGQGAMGVAITLQDAVAQTVRYPIWQAVPAGIARAFETLALIVDGLVGMVRGTVPADVTGPIGLYQVTGEVAKTGWANLFELCALVSVNLFLLNLLPIPPLDGGHLLFIAIEALRGGKRIEPQREGLVHFIGMVVLLALMVLVTYKDFIRLMSGQSLLP